LEKKKELVKRLGSSETELRKTLRERDILN
jgi:hypothetical protein